MIGSSSFSVDSIRFSAQMIRLSPKAQLNYFSNLDPFHFSFLTCYTDETLPGAFVFIPCVAKQHLRGADARLRGGLTNEVRLCFLPCPPPWVLTPSRTCTLWHQPAYRTSAGFRRGAGNKSTATLLSLCVHTCDEHVHLGGCLPPQTPPLAESWSLLPKGQ